MLPENTKNVQYVLIKDKFFHQSNWSRTIDLDTTQIMLFKSPRILRQIDHFERQLRKVEILGECYNRATSEPYRYLMVDLETKTSECLQVGFHITAPNVTIIHILSEIANETNVTNEREKRAYAEALAEHKSKGTLEKLHMSV